MVTDACDICGRERAQHMEIVGVGRVCPISGTTFRPKFDREAAERAGDDRVARLTEALIDARDNGLIYWEPQTSRGHNSKSRMLARISAALEDTHDASN